MINEERSFHEAWLGRVQPVDGLVVSIPVLMEAKCWVRQPAAVQQVLLAACPLDNSKAKTGPRHIANLAKLLADVLQLTPARFDTGSAVPDALCCTLPQSQEVIRPTMALRRTTAAGEALASVVSLGAPTPASRAGGPYVMLVTDLSQAPGLNLDAKDTRAGAWPESHYEKFVRLLQETHVPIGLLATDKALRLVYAPPGESVGSLTFQVDDMAGPDGRVTLSAFIMLLSAERFFAADVARQLPAILKNSRLRQADVTSQLGEQVFEALQILLEGMAAAAERDGAEPRAAFATLVEQRNEHLSGGLLTVLLRLVFVLYCEDNGLLPTEHPLYQDSMSVLGLFYRLRDDSAAYPDTMDRRYGAWGHIIALFRAIYLGVVHGEGESRLHLPSRHGSFFDPNKYPFLEGWADEGSAPIDSLEEQARVELPTVDDGTVYAVLERLVMLDGQRLSYRSLDVEQLGSVYEGLMGYSIRRLEGDALCLRDSGVWVTGEEVLAIPADERFVWFKAECCLPGAKARSLGEKLRQTDTPTAALAVMQQEAHRKKAHNKGSLVLQPGAERRRTSSHYTPRAMTEPLVEKALGPLLAAMGEAPSSVDLLSLKICDPAMGSGAFLVAACRYLATKVCDAWRRENTYDQQIASHGDALQQARKLVASRCLYGVDRNAFAVDLAKLSLWLISFEKDAPFTFLDHACKHGDSLIGLDLAQIEAFDWQANAAPVPTLSVFVKEALGEACEAREKILGLALQTTGIRYQLKHTLLADASDAMEPVRFLADLLLDCYFSGADDRERRKKRDRVLAEVQAVLCQPNTIWPEHFTEAVARFRAHTPSFHWQIEFPEAFVRKTSREVLEKFDSFVGNPPFAGKTGMSRMGTPNLLDWLQTIHVGSHGNADYCVHFFLRASNLLGTHGTIGMVACNTIAQGDSRESGLDELIHRDAIIYSAMTDVSWPGKAAVTVSLVWLAQGYLRNSLGQFFLNGQLTSYIAPNLTSKKLRSRPATLMSNTNLSGVGSYPLGTGFVLTPHQKNEFINRNKKNAERIRPFLGGANLNSSPTQKAEKFIIDFGRSTEEEAKAWPELYEHLRTHVKPQRDKNKRKNRRETWWQYAETSHGLYTELRKSSRCLVCCLVTKHLSFSFVPTDQIIDASTLMLSFTTYSPFAVLQSRVHETWARLHSSTLKTDLRYASSDAFFTFPFPRKNPQSIFEHLELVGCAFYEARADYMSATKQGLTKTYNAMVDAQNHSPQVTELRRLTEALDRAVLDAYGWRDIKVPPYCYDRSDPAAVAALDHFKDEVIDQLHALNVERARQEGQPIPMDRAPAPGQKLAKKRRSRQVG